MEPKICFITAIYGNYEATCKPFIEQTIPTDFICFTNNPDIESNGWIIDTTPYYLTNPSAKDTGTEINSIINNKHTFNIAKYFKCAFQNIPRLKKYDAIIWLDGTIIIKCPTTSVYILKHIKERKIIGWKHPTNNKLIDEVIESDFNRYTSTNWFGQDQPYQNIYKQYVQYIKNGFIPECEKGVWITCFIAFDNKCPDISSFLDLWYLHIINFTTQDQISFPFVVQLYNIIPYTLPDDEIKAVDTGVITDFYIKADHGR